MYKTNEAQNINRINNIAGTVAGVRGIPNRVTLNGFKTLFYQLAEIDAKLDYLVQNIGSTAGAGSATTAAANAAAAKAPAKTK